MLHEIRFSDRTVKLVELRQSVVYEGLIEGLPTQRMNKAEIAAAMKIAQEIIASSSPVLLPPKTKEVEWLRPTPYPFGKPEQIPSICCIGRFHSYTHARDSSKDFSMLCVVWFQEQMGPPLDSEIINQFALVNWASQAADFEL